MRISSAFNVKTYHRHDWLNIGVLIFVFGLVLLLVSPAHGYPITDDWAYAHSVQDMVSLNYSPSEWSMATALSHVAWGAIFVWFFGFSFTVLTVSTLVLSLTGIILFYLLLRQLEVGPAFSLFGALVLFLNPIYIYLSYSYMSDVPFVTYTIAALLCYVIGVKRKNQRSSYYWLLSGSLFVSLAYLDRQPGAILIPVIAFYLLWESPKRIQFGRILAATLLPCAAIVLYAAWASMFPPTLAAHIQAEFRAGTFRNFGAWLSNRLIFLSWGTFLVGFILVPLLSFRIIRRKRIGLLSSAMVFVTLFFLLVLGYLHQGSWVPAGFGNILGSTGFMMLDYNSAPLFNDNVWLVLCIISALAVSIVLATTFYKLAKWRLLLASRTPIGQSIQSADTQNNQHLSSGQEAMAVFRVSKKGIRILIAPPHPRVIVYLFGLITFLASAALSYVTSDRYWLPVLPALITFAITILPASKKEYTMASRMLYPAILRWALVGGMAAMTLIGQQDYMAHATTRWDAGEQLVAQGVPLDNISMGTEWTGWYLSDEGVQYFHEHGDIGTALNPAELLVDPVFVASDVPVNGYTVIKTLTYPSLLRGGQGQVLILERDSAR